MRNIKFRYWNGQNFSEIKLGDGWYDMPENIVFQQFTGLLDKNGKEIYEGDLVMNNDHMWEITWKEGCVYIENRTGKGTWWIGGEHMHCEIIGNIYENKDLL